MTSNQSFQLSPKYRILYVDDDLFGLESRAALTNFRILLGALDEMRLRFSFSCCSSAG
jgi:hypothetical protein